MKKFLPLMIVLLSFAHGYSQTSQLLISESFTGYTNSNLNGQGGWAATGNANYVQVANATPLAYPGYAAGAQYVNLVQRADYSPGKHPDDPSKSFIGSTAVTPGSSPVFYMSFLVRVPNASGTSSTTSAGETLALRTSTGDNIAYFHIADNGTSNLKFGISKDGGTATYSGANYTFNTTYLIVIRYDVLNNAWVNTFDDDMYMWVNPSLSTQPATSGAQVGIDLGNFKSDGGFTGNVNSLQLFQDQNSATASFDAFRVAYAKNYSNLSNNALAAWDALNPIAISLPVTFGEINGYAKGTGIQIDWNVYTELNVNHYEIERSTDGVSFSKAGSVVAQNGEGTLYYNWFDAEPADGTYFYRIKNADNDGKYTYSSVIKVSLEKATGSALTVYPNPVTGNHVSFQVSDLRKGDYTIEIINMAGQQVYNKRLSHSGGAVSQSLQLPSTIKTGIYNISITGKDYKTAKQFLVH